MNFNWNNIRPLSGSLNEGFEELVCQLAKKESIPNKLKFIRKGKPDAGVECFWILKDNREYAWQAKFFISSFSSTQWGEIDSSVKTTLDKHPRVVKYYISVPYDPPDARLDGKTSLLEKWNKRVIKWEQWARDKEMEVEFIPWWSSDLIERLQKTENEGLLYFWFNKEEFTNDWCREQNELAIADLGNRYTPEVNVELDFAVIFDGISKNKDFYQKLYRLFHHVLKKGESVIPEDEELKKEKQQLVESLSEVRKISDRIMEQNETYIPVKTIIELIGNLSKVLDEVTLFYSNLKEILPDPEESEKLQRNEKREDKRRRLRDFETTLYSLESFLNSTTVKVANHPFLLIEGEAGIGKSHFLADMVKHRNENDLQSLFFLGQHFNTTDDPWTQIFKKSKINCSVDEFLGALESKAQINNSRFVILIDAINEGRGRYFWRQNIKSFLLKIKKYKSIGLVLSIRSSYSELIFPREEFSEEEIIRFTHSGFSNKEYQASKIFFENYNIELPSTPLLHPEFKNPLFLKLFCEGLNKAGLTKIPDGLRGITSVFNFFISSVNTRLSRPEKFAYSSSINLVKKALDALILKKVETSEYFIPYEEAYVIVAEAISPYTNKKGFIDELISEGVLSKNLFKDYTNDSYEESVYMAYERFEDHLTVSNLLDKVEDLDAAFKSDGSLHKYVKDEYSPNEYRGLIEAFSIQIPEKYQRELYEFTNHLKDNISIAEAFVESLAWRKVDTIGEHLNEYINRVVVKYYATSNLFWNTIYTVAAVENNYYNADFLHRNLIRYSLAERDTEWTVFLRSNYDEYSGINRIIDWSWNTQDDKQHISDESIFLSAIALAWLHTSTNRRLRDSATKAMICLLKNRIHLLIELLKKFEEVNDPYVYERLFTVAYGCTLITEQKERLPALSNYIFEIVFDKEEIYPHVLLRDYSRGVIEYTIYLGFDLGFEVSKIRPPYKSQWPVSTPSQSELEELYEDSDEYRELWSSIMSYGDFARYTIGTNAGFSDWTASKKGEPLFDKKKEYESFKSTLNESQLKLLEALDPVITEDTGRIIEMEGIPDFNIVTAIGRKSEEELAEAKVFFKKSISAEQYDLYEKEFEPFLDHNNKMRSVGNNFDLKVAQRMIFTKVLELGWDPKLHGKFDKNIGTGRGRGTKPHEHFLKSVIKKVNLPTVSPQLMPTRFN
ncbi:MAG: hypothetical protein ACI9N1_000350 [Flavobacteriales bacterium]|jgi:hypothetical protein